MVAGSALTSPLLKGLTPQPLEYTWEGPHMELPACLVDHLVIATTVDTTEDMIATMIENTTNPIDGGLLLLITAEELTDLAHAHALTLHVIITERKAMGMLVLPREGSEVVYDIWCQD